MPNEYISKLTYSQNYDALVQYLILDIEMSILTHGLVLCFSEKFLRNQVKKN